MAAQKNLECCLDDIGNLPRQLRRNFELMRDLDQRTEDLRAKIENLATEYKSSVRNLSSEERVAILKQIKEGYDKCKEFSDNKLQIATQLYEMVDKNIQQLDLYLDNIEADMKEKPIERNDDDSSSSKRKKKGQAQKKKADRDHSKGKSSAEEALKSAQKLKFVCTPSMYGLRSGTSSSVSPSGVLDMPVDPRKATSCLCNKVSYGERIRCDNPDCTIKWFHLACVGLATKPRRKWLCRSCFQEKKKK